MIESIIKAICPICGSEMISEGVHNGIDYVYPPFYCNNCGYSEKCQYESKNCKKCEMYEKCFKI